MNRKILLDKKIILNESTLITSINDEDLVFDAVQGIYFRLNKSGKVIISLLQKEILIRNLIETYANKFSISTEAASSDVIEFLDIICKKDLATIV